MNYNEYNDKIELPENLYEKTLSSVKLAVSKHNQVQRRRKRIFLSAACFAIFVSTISAAKYFSNNPATNMFEAVSTPTENSNNDNSVKIKANASKYPHKIIIDNKIYSQYYFGDEKGDKDNDIELKQSKVGELICEIDYFNLTDDLSNFEPMSFEEAKTNKFYKAKAYKYTDAKSDNIIIVQAKDEYYLFYLDGLTDNYTIEELFNVYTANGNNKIVGIEIWQDEFFENSNVQDNPSTEVRPLQKGTINKQEAINSILTILNNTHSSLSGHSDYLNEYDEALKKYYNSGLMSDYPLMENYGVYELKIRFSEGSELIPDKSTLNILLKRESLYFCICAKENKTYYFLENSEYDKLIEIINSAIN